VPKERGLSHINRTEAWAAAVAVDGDCAKSVTITQMVVQLLDYGKHGKSSSQHVNSVHPFSRFEKYNKNVLVMMLSPITGQ